MPLECERHQIFEASELFEKDFLGKEDISKCVEFFLVLANKDDINWTVIRRA